MSPDRLVAWVKSAFDPERLSDEEAETLPEWPELRDPRETLAFVTRLFNEARATLEDYSDEVVSEGLREIQLDDMHAMRQDSVEHVERIAFVNSMLSLFADFFAVRCPNFTARTKEFLLTPLAQDCYMWFDVIPFHCGDRMPNQSLIDQAFLELLDRLLRIPHLACQEAAIHGLWHWSLDYKDECEQIKERFLAETPDLHPELVDYALNGPAL